MLIPTSLFLPPPEPAATAPRKHWRGPVLAACALALLAGPAAHGDIQKSSKTASQGEHAYHQGGVPPPAAVAGKASVPLGGSVEIILQAHGGVSQEIDFLIRQPPVHGTLAGPPRQLTRDTASVTYIHRAGDGLRDDVFTFAVQVLGGRVSVAEAVAIAVADTGPDLAATPAELDFGAVNTGDTSRAEITLENRGGGLAAGVFVPPAPWEVDGPSGYRLARGESQTFPLVFRPVRSGSLSETLRLPGQKGGRGVHLIGIGLETLAAPGAEVTVPIPPVLATPPTSGIAPLIDGPRVEPAPALPTVSTSPATAGSAAPSSPLPAAAPASRASPIPGRVTAFAVLLGVGLAAGAVLSARGWQGRRRAAREGGLPGILATTRGVPARERINR